MCYVHVVVLLCGPPCLREERADRPVELGVLIGATESGFSKPAISKHALYLWHQG
jgi:hypothetical protein